MGKEPFVVHRWEVGGIGVQVVVDSSGLEVFVEVDDNTLVCQNARISWSQLDAEKVEVLPDC